MPLDPESEALRAGMLAAEASRPGMSPEARRSQALALGRALQGEKPAIASVIDVPLRHGGITTMLRVYDPRACSVAGCVVWLHGGGFTTGNLETHDTLCRRLALLSRQVVVSVDYRLAPENPYPAALEDCFAAVAWAAMEARRLGATSGRIAVGGSSAGGNLAAAVALRAAAEGGPTIVWQTLVYPAVDATMALLRAAPHGEGYQLTAAMMAEYWRHYIGDADPCDPLLSPLRAPSLDRVAPAHVVRAEFDPLGPEIDAYAERLAAAGRLARLSRYDGVMHGFFAQAGRLAKARAAQEEVCALLAEALSEDRPDPIEPCTVRSDRALP